MSTESENYVVYDAETRRVSFAHNDHKSVTLYDFNGGYNSTVITVPEFNKNTPKGIFPAEPIPDMAGTVITREELGL